MRVSLCFRWNDRVHRVVWINESKGGLYVGVLGGHDEFHVSYHSSGLRHTKLASVTHNEHDDVPICDWKGVRQLQHLSFFITKDWFGEGNCYVGDGKSEISLILDDQPFASISRCGMDFWLFDRASEVEYFATIRRLSERQNDVRPLVEVVAVLKHFRNCLATPG